MSKEIQRNYLEINSIKELKESKFFEEKYSIENVEPANFQINKFFYKNIGKIRGGLIILRIKKLKLMFLKTLMILRVTLNLSCIMKKMRLK